ncbi:glycosyltransferase family 4 protein [Gordoniibacillus kamchatkensis]|uniref:glycosyltransferase family 4 protein n=1 Tax=Gordoniibacillus kamchatkensis TaxID=1590651 RepID=UPI000698C58A|nr:glycosyltransferase family 4 protein [Paenibacillus sp. VKM B-2647]
MPAVEDVKELQAHPNRLLYVGRLTAIKGIEELLGAVSLLKRHKPKVRLAIVGKGGPAYTAKLKRLAGRLRISSNLNWLGKLKPSKVQRLYRSYGAVVVTSRYESFGLVALEALSHGVPLVSTRGGGLRSFVSNSNATVIPRAKAASIAAGILRMWRSPQLKRKRIANGLDTARRFGWPQIAARYRELFADIVTRRGLENDGTSLEADPGLESETPRASLGRAKPLRPERVF